MCRGVAHTLWANTGYHYVVSNPGKRSAMFYDDALAFLVTDFDLAAKRLSMMHEKLIELTSQMINNRLAAPLADLGQATGPLDIPDEGAAGCVRATTTGGGWSGNVRPPDAGPPERDGPGAHEPWGPAASTTADRYPWTTGEAGRESGGRCSQI